MFPDDRDDILELLELIALRCRAHFGPSAQWDVFSVLADELRKAQNPYENKSGSIAPKT